jgi:LCP family protein required for cell wall assembly
MRTLPIERTRKFARLVGIILALMLLAGCGMGGRPSYSIVGEGQTAATPRPTMTLTPTPTELPWPTFVVDHDGIPTPAPEVAQRVALPEETKVWLLLGSEGELPARGRTNAIHLLLINERLSKASVISIPGSTFVYLPGEGMGRINTAYALGGMKLVSDTLVYNFGLRPDRFVVAHEKEFIWLVDDLDRLEVSVLFPIRDDCGGLPAGLHSMDGKKALCYISYEGDDEIFRARRQQQVLQLLFTKLVQRGRLAKLPLMYSSYNQYLDTDVSLLDLIFRIPLALRLGDPDRVKSFVLGWEQLESWELPDQTRTSVLLPRDGKIQQLVGQAVEAISEPSALNAIVLTYAADLTEVISVTRTYEAALTEAARPTRTPTPEGTLTPIPPGTTPRPTSTPKATATQGPYPIATVPTASFFDETPDPYP